MYGTGIDWAGRIVEKISGKPLDEYFGERIFRPLGMADSDFSVPDEKAARLVPVHRRRSDGTFDATDRQPRAPVSGGRGLFSPPPRLARFFQMILNGGAADRGQNPAPHSVR